MFKTRKISTRKLINLKSLKESRIVGYNNHQLLYYSEQLFMTCKNKMGYTIRRYADGAGVKQIRMHDLRHSHASLLINQGIQPNIVQ